MKSIQDKKHVSVSLFTDGFLGLEMALRSTFDLLLLDLGAAHWKWDRNSASASPSTTEHPNISQLNKVRDFGTGFTSSRIWNRPFSKSDQRAAETAPGIGLGLSLCGRLAKEMDGKLEVGNLEVGNLEVGAQVTLRVPLIQLLRRVTNLSQNH